MEMQPAYEPVNRRDIGMDIETHHLRNHSTEMTRMSFMGNASSGKHMRKYSSIYGSEKVNSDISGVY